MMTVPNVGALVPFQFEITGPMTMPEMTKQKGYVRAHVIALFEELARRGYGVYREGRKGPGNCAMFTPNEKCPKKYAIMVDARTIPESLKGQAIMPVGGLPTLPPLAKVPRQHKEELTEVSTKVTPPAPVPPVVSKTKVVEAVQQMEESPNSGEWKGSTVGLVNDWLRGLGRTIVKDSNSAFVGYECVVFGDEILAVCRIRGGGTATMSDALKKIWDQIKTRVGYRHTTRAGTKPFDAVMTKLMGRGYHVLDRPANMGYDASNISMEEEVTDDESSNEESEG